MKTFITTTGAVILGVFIAGLAMNLLRNNAVVKSAINGYDA